MQNELKHMQERQGTLEQYLLPKEKKSNKRTSSQLSPSTEEITAKKVNLSSTATASAKTDRSRKENMNNPLSTGITTLNSDNTPTRPGTTEDLLSTQQNEPKGPLAEQATLLKDIVEPLVKEVRELKDSVKAEYSKLENIITNQQETINKLEATISLKQTEVSTDITNQIINNSDKLNDCFAANQVLQRENEELKTRLTQIEIMQLGNNVIISGMQEQSWETYDTTKERVVDTIVAAMGGEDENAARKEARKIEIACCSRVGRYQLGRPRPISVTFQKKEDKQRLLENKRNLPSGVYVNEEYPIHVKKSRDTLRPILRLAKSIPDYKEKSKLQGDKLVINGISYTVNDLHRLPPELAAYKAAQRTDNHSLVFHGELSPFSNFHKSPFIHNSEQFPTAEHFIQYQKAMYFGDSHTANAILRSNTPYEAKKLSYQINGSNQGEWKEQAFDLCFPGIREKFVQNPDLLNMLLTTTPLTLAEASLDKTWGTGVSIRDKNALSQSHWHSPGLMSKMLHKIREDCK